LTSEGFAFTPPKIESMSVSPGCTHPGGTVAAQADFGPVGGLDEAGYANLFARLRVFYFGQMVASADPVWEQIGGGGGLPGSARSTWQAYVPWFAPWGPYAVVFSIGPSQRDRYSYDSRSATVTVSPLFC
jgi:hypothetical protein